MSIEAMKLALEALESCDSDYNWDGDGDEYQVDVFDRDKVNNAITALRQAIEQAQKQEPVAWGVIASNTGKMCQVELDYEEVSDIKSKWLVPLYTSPPQRQPLSDEQKKNIFLKFYGKHWAYTNQIKYVMEAVEAAHGIKGEA